MLQHLKHLEINGCIGLRMLKGGPTTLDLGILRQAWPDSLANLKRLSTLRMENVEFLELPNSIGEIAGLQELSLGDSSVNIIPESIGKLKSLVKLKLSGTDIIELPNSIGELKSLKVLLMDRCKLKKLPKAIGMLEKLEYLGATLCESLEGEVPMEIGALSSLKSLWLGGTRISVVPPSISSLSLLEDLIISSSRLQQIPDLSNLTNLERLVLCDHERPKYVKMPHAPYLPWIGRLTKLTWLNLDLSDMTVLPAEFSALVDLQCLQLRGSTFQSLEHFPPNIWRVTFFDLRSTDGWSCLRTFKYLSRVHVSRSGLTEIPLDALGQLQNLCELIVSECQALEKLYHVTCLRKLSYLAVRDCPRLVEIQGIERLESLENLIIICCPLLKELPDLQDLTKLRISNCHSDETLV
ncbi:uncharacterized protein LOC130134458 [Syzygium oleosum]|uniref:uncharacterized protein LOC130134458 n=1 Tax=Syzygium oleosum TaxID=219896 RepID=UPI0024BBB823|nr:uncharacterized protein LOC130134458 [Syzygium oleosum]